MKTDPMMPKMEFLLPPGGETEPSWMHLTCIHAVERAHVILVCPGRKQDEGDIFTMNCKIPLIPDVPAGAQQNRLRPFGGEKVHRTFSGFRLTSRRERGYRAGVYFVRPS